MTKKVRKIDQPILKIVDDTLFTIPEHSDGITSHKKEKIKIMNARSPSKLGTSRYRKMKQPLELPGVKAKIDPYAFKMMDEMRFTNEEIIRMNITLGITGDICKDMGVFYTDFMVTAAA